MPSYLVISDIHANLEALTAVFEHARTNLPPPEAVWCLGDIVGYGPNPSECIELLRNYKDKHGQSALCIKGNHDEGVLKAGNGEVDSTTSEAVNAGWKWTYEKLQADQRTYLRNLPEILELSDTPQSVLLVHASPQDSLHKYMVIPSDIESSIEHCKQRICLFGHTHLASYFECDPKTNYALPRLFQPADEGSRTISSEKVFINPGTVGQPRWGRLIDQCYEGVKEASYVWLTLEADTIQVSCHFVPYDFTETVSKLDQLEPALKVPDRWKKRLSQGLR